MSMDTVPTTVEDWYKKAIHFQTQWEWADEIARRNTKPYALYQSFSMFSSSRAKDPNVMDINAIKIPKLSAEEHRHYQGNGLCFHCQKADHLSSACPTFPSDSKLKKLTAKKVHQQLLGFASPFVYSTFSLLYRTIVLDSTGQLTWVLLLSNELLKKKP